MPRTVTTVDTKSSKTPQVPPAISYRLSDSFFLDLGWTTKPDVSLVYPVVTMKAKFSHPVISPWFQERSQNLRVQYSNGKTLYLARKDGTGKIYYPNGKLAVNIEKGGIDKYRTRVWVNSPGEVDRDGVRRPSQLCALFDSLGCGVVYDRCMNKRLIYNQTEGIFLDTPNGIPVRWKWHNITYSGSTSLMNEENEQNSLIPEVPMSVICVLPADEKLLKEKGNESGKWSENESRSDLATKLTKSEIDFRENFEHRRYLNTAKILPREVCPLKPIVLQLNPYMALRILTQSEISLSFFAKGHHTQLKIGVLYNPFDKLKVTEVEDFSIIKEKVLCPFENFPANTKSMLRFKKIVQSIKMTSCKPVPMVIA